MSCSSNNDSLHINYLVPLKAPSLKGRVLELVVLNKRSGPMLIAGDARSYFPKVIDKYALYVRRQGTHSVERIGESDLTGLFRSAFTQRLRFLGADALDTKRKGTPVLTLAIEQFSLQLEDSQWKALIKYKATIKQYQLTIIEETVKGRADRRNVLGSADANRLMGNLFTQVVNQLDVVQFLQKAAASKDRLAQGTFQDIL
jgi:hypothetical protein